MAVTESGFSGAGLAVTWLVHAALGAFVLAPSIAPKQCGTGAAQGSRLGHEEIMIEAAIAYKKPEEKKQPQKKKSPKKAKKKVSISRDADKKVEPKKEEEKKEEIPSWEDFKRDSVDEPENPDLDEGDPTKTGGSFDGKKYGWADENKGHPYMQEIARHVRFEIPTLEKGKGEAYACIRLADDGKVVDTKVRKSGNTNIDRAAEEALRRLVEVRNKDKELEPVPSELRTITTHWICFKPTG